MERCMYEDHVMVKRSAVQCIANLILNQNVIKLYECDGADRAKFSVILLLEEDLDTVLAASGALTILKSCSKKACNKVFDAKDWHKAFMQMIVCKNELLHFFQKLE